MNRLCVIFLCVAMLLLAACGGSRLSVDPTWTTTPNTLTVVIGEPYVENSDDVEDDLPEYASKFGDWLSLQLQMELRLHTNLNPEMRLEKDENFVMVQLPLEKNMETFHVPNPEKISGLHGIVLSVHPILFKRKVDACLSRNGCMNNSHLVSKGTYVYTDMDNRRILGYGFFYVSDSFTFAMTKGNCENVVGDMAEAILEDTPLE